MSVAQAVDLQIENTNYQNSVSNTLSLLLLPCFHGFQLNIGCKEMVRSRSNLVDRAHLDNMCKDGKFHSEINLTKVTA